MHAHSILHGDLKPENVMLEIHDTAGREPIAGSCIAKVTDFGVARIRRGLGSTVRASALGI
jgi:serine/threonine protein kinase